MKKRRLNDDDFYYEEESVSSRSRVAKNKWLHGPLFKIMMWILAICLAFFIFVLVFNVKKIEVTGAQYCSKDEVIEWVQSDKLASNSLYIWWKHKFTDAKQLPLVEDSEITLKNPWTVQVRVYEKSIIGYLVYDNKNTYFDKDGTVILKTEEVLDGIPCIEGLDVSDVKLHKTLTVSNKKVFQYILEVSQTVQKYDLKPDRIVFDLTDVTMYFGNVTVALGMNNLTDKLTQLSPILTKIQETYPDQKGTLHLENYTKSNSAISFEKEAVTEDASKKTDASGSDSEDEEENYDDSYDESYDESYEDEYEYDENYDSSYDDEDYTDDSEY